MAAVASLNREGGSWGDTKDSIIILQALGDVPGGRTLDVSKHTEDVIKCGHVVAKTADGNYYPVPVASGAYAALASGDTYVGIVRATTLKLNPQVGILTMGQVREAALPYPVTAAIKTALSHIQFI